MSRIESNLAKPRKQYGARRVERLSPTISTETRTDETPARQADLVTEVDSLDTLVLTLGDSRDEFDQPSRLIGAIRHADEILNNVRTGTSCLRGSVSRTAAMVYSSALPVLSSITSSGSDLNTAITNARGVQLGPFVTLIDTFPLPARSGSEVSFGHIGYDDNGDRDTDEDRYLDVVSHGLAPTPIVNGQFDWSSTDTGRALQGRTVHSIDINVSSSDAEEALANGITLSYGKMGNSFLPHILATGIHPNTGAQLGALMYVEDAATVTAQGIDLGATLNTYDAQVHQNLARSMILTPDEYIFRYGDAIIDFATRAHTFVANDVVGSWQKGGRSQWWGRGNSLTPEFIGHMLHLGMCIRLNQPIKNCYAFVDGMTPEFNNDGTVKNGKWSLYVGTDDDTLGHGSLEAYSIADALFEGNLASEISEGADDFDTILRYESDETGKCHLRGINASVNPLATYLFDCTDGTHTGLFMGHESLAFVMNPGLVHTALATPEDRDPATGDVFTGLNWLLANSCGNFGQQLASISPYFMEFFTDFKSGDTVDVYATSSRTDPDAIKIAKYLTGDGLTETLRHSAPTANAGPGWDGSSDFFSKFFSAGFINVAERNKFVAEVDDMSQRTYRVGGRFGAGVAHCGDSKTTVVHDMTHDGAVFSVDLSMRHSGAGHYGLMPVSNVFGRGSMQLRHFSSAGALVEGTLSQPTVANSTRESSLMGCMDVSSYFEFNTFVSATVKEAVLSALSQFGRSLESELTQYYSTRMPVRWIKDGIATDLLQAGFYDSISQTSLGGPGSTNDLRSLRFIPAASAGLYNGTVRGHNYFLDKSYFELGPNNELSLVMTYFDQVFRRVEASKNVKPYKTDAPHYSFESVSLIAELSNRTGNPATQAALEGIILACADSTAGVPTFLSPYVLDRMLWSREIHGMSTYRENIVADLLFTILPSNIASKFTTNMAATRILLSDLGMIGENPARLVYDVAGSIRTIYDLEREFDGTTTIMNISYGYNFFDNLPGDSSLIGNWAQAWPGFNLMSRLVTGYGDTVRPLFAYGVLANPAASGSTVEGLEGLRTPAAPGDPFGLPVTLFNGDARPSDYLTIEDFELMASQVQGSDIRDLWNVTDLMFVGFDQDLLSLDEAIHASLLFKANGTMLEGPSTYILSFDKSFNLNSRSASESVGAKVAVPQATPSPSSSEEGIASPETPEDD